MMTDQAITIFLTEMDRAGALFRSKPTDDGDPQIAGKLAALEAVLDLHRALGGDRRAREPVFQIMSDLDVGSSRKRLIDAAREATAAGLVDFLHDTDGMTIKDALQEVALTTGLSPVALENFRKEILSNRTKSIAPAIWQQFLDAAKASKMSDHEKAKAARKYVRRVFGK